MKKILFLLFAIVAMVACDKENKDGRKPVDPNATITIRPTAGVRAQVGGLTALQIVEQATAIRFQTHYSDNVYQEEARVSDRGFADAQRDFSIPALKMWSIDVIPVEPDENGDYFPVGYKRDFTHAFSVFITDVNNDTIAHVPDAVINAARPLIEAAYLAGNYDEVYRLFDEAFTFLPIE